MQMLLSTRTLARFVLACFLLALGVAVASPAVSPKWLQLVCSAGGAVQLVALDGDNSIPGASVAGDCPLCIVVGAPPPLRVPLAVAPTVPALAPLAAVDRPRVAARTAPPLPARGPPAIA